METWDLPLKQRVADAMAEADKNTAHLHPCSEECARLWTRIFHDTLWGITSDRDTTPDRGSTSGAGRVTSAPRFSPASGNKRATHLSPPPDVGFV